MGLDNRAGERQPHTHAVRLRREKWLEDLAGKVVGNPRPGIPNSQFDFAIRFAGPGFDDNTSRIDRAGLYCVNAVHNKVEQDLRQVHTIAKHARQIGLHHQSQDGVLIDRFRVDQSDNVLHQILHGKRLHINHMSPRELAHPSEDVGGATIILANIVEDCTQLFEVRFSPGLQIEGAERSRRAGEVAARITERLDQVESLDQDRILRSYLTLIEATLRTSFYQRGADGRPKSGDGHRLRYS